MDEAVVKWGLTALYILLVLYLIIRSHRSYRRRKLIEALPTSKVAGVFIGLVEVKGTAECREYLTSFLSETPCIYYTYKIEEHWSKREVVTTITNGKLVKKTQYSSGTTVINSGENTTNFYLLDDTGFLLIRPKGAIVEGQKTFQSTAHPHDSLYYSKGPITSIPHSDHIRTFTEYSIPLHSPIYVLGQSQERADCVAPEIVYSDKVDHFLISIKSEEEIVSQNKRKEWIFIILGLILTVSPFVYFYTLDHRSDWSPLLYSALIYCCIWTISWTWITYNFLVEHRNRVRQAISLINIQLQRRSDLIPQLCSILSAYSYYEQQFLTHIAELRLVQISDKSCIPAIYFLKEQCPQLSADELFLQVQQEITDTENRIALARDYHNAILKHFHNNIQRFPECIFTKTLGFYNFPPLAMDSFNRAEPSVDFET